MWNGNAKKCFYDNFEFEGNFSNGLKTGKGKELDEKRNVIVFEGEYLNGKRWIGKGKDLMKIITRMKMMN